ncbi:hypothetical protein BLNAU_8415 [Blattamonas nauphoetae]|uniref:Uncharacterized protein n=1 Tax=Blattamonas nauphoetae TaxID=2049346 RepID=A0ABQ9XYM1_9EUKA|nr:hypothetical protein BLNAU_8415 [Blattamonas nauphoetae]
MVLWGMEIGLVPNGEADVIVAQNQFGTGIEPTLFACDLCRLWHHLIVCKNETDSLSPVSLDHPYTLLASPLSHLSQMKAIHLIKTTHAFHRNQTSMDLPRRLHFITHSIQPTLDDSLEGKALHFLESVILEEKASTDAFLGSFGRTIDLSLTDFVQSIVVLLSSASKTITTTTMKMLDRLITHCSARVHYALVQADLIPQIINTLNPRSLLFIEAVDIHAYLLFSISRSVWLATPHGLAELAAEHPIEQAVHETVFQRVLAPSEQTSEHFELFLTYFGQQTLFATRRILSHQSPSNITTLSFATLPKRDLDRTTHLGGFYGEDKRDRNVDEVVWLLDTVDEEVECPLLQISLRRPLLPFLRRSVLNTFLDSCLETSIVI